MLLLLMMAAQAAELTYQQALDEALVANTTVLGAEADRASAEGTLMASRGVYDPRLTLGLSQTVINQQNLIQFVLQDTAFTYLNTTDSADLSWKGGLSQALPTGTSWSLDFTNGRDNITRLYEDTETGDTFTDPEQTTFNTSLSGSLTQQLLKGYKLSYNLQTVESARRGLTTAEIALTQARQEVLAGTARAYWDLYAAGRSLQVAERAVRVAEEERRIVSAQVEAGNLAPIERTRVEAAVAQTRLSLIQAQIAQRTASDVLAVLLGRDPGDPLELSTEPGGVPPGLDVGADQATEAALAGNPSLQLQRLRLESAEIELANARHARLPSLSVTASYGPYGYMSSEEDGELSYGETLNRMVTFDQTYRYLGADFSAPLGGRAERGAVSSAAGGVERARLDLLAAERELARQVNDRVRTLENARQRVQLAELNLKLAEETLAAEKARQSVGRAIQKDVLEAQRARDEAEAGLISARVEYRKAVVDLKALQGKL